MSEWLRYVIEKFGRYDLRALSLSVFDGNPLYVAALAHPFTSLQLYLHVLNKALWCLDCASRSMKCDISSASLLYICRCRCL